MSNQYLYNGNKYTLKPLTLSLMKDIMPVIIKLRKLIYRYTNDIDMSDVNRLRSVIADLECAKEQLAQKTDKVSNEERLNIADRIYKLNEKILLHRSELENDSTISGKIKLYNECSAMAVVELFSDTDLLNPVIDKLLFCTDNDTEIDLTAPGAAGFLSLVFADFFLLMMKGNAG
jgi:predicted RNA-binding protein with EMAP domain